MDSIPQKNKIKIIITAICVVISIVLIIIFRESLFKVKENISDNEKFYKEYNKVSVDNVFKYVTVKESIDLFNYDQAVIFFGFKECKWCQSYAPILNNYAKENNIDKIYYVDIKEDRKNNTSDYQMLVELLKEYILTDNNGKKRIYVPDVYFVKDGQIIGHNNDTSTEDGVDVDSYYEERGESLKEKINTLFNELNSSCDDSKEGC